MVRPSNTVIVILNVITLTVSVVAIASSRYVSERGGSECQRVMETPLLIVGIFLFVVSLAGLMGSCCQISFAMCFYSFVMFMMILGMVVFAVFLLFVTNRGVGKAVSGKGFNDQLRLGDYSNWLQNHVVEGDTWAKLKSCLIDAQICKSLGDRIGAQIFKNNLSPIQSGCCKPPTYCGFESKNATFWLTTASGPKVTDSDCTEWSNDEDKLCFDCKSCKGGVLANMRNYWRLLQLINVCLLIFLIIIYSIACCAYRNTQSHYDYVGYRAYP